MSVSIATAQLKLGQGQLLELARAYLYWHTGNFICSQLFQYPTGEIDMLDNEFQLFAIEVTPCCISHILLLGTLRTANFASLWK